MRTIIFLLFTLLIGSAVHAQQDTLKVEDTTTYRIVKYDGTEFIGKIISTDAREVLLLTDNRGPIYIPQHVIKDIVPVNASEYNQSGEYIGEDIFATRYFITTNGLPIKKGDHYVQWNWFGPDFQFGVGDNFGVGFMTTWLAVPIIATAKYSVQLGAKSQMAFGALAGSTSWLSFAEEDLNVQGILPFTTYSYGTRRANFAISAGYGGVWDRKDPEGRALASVAGMVKIGRKFSLVFDSFLVAPGKWKTMTSEEEIYHPETDTYETITTTHKGRNPGIAILIPGIRWHQAPGKAFQFGFTGLIIDDDVIPFPVPMVQWYRTL